MITSFFRIRKFKIALSRALLPFLIVWMTVMPSRSYAFFPLVAMAFSAVTTTGITFTAADLAGLSIALAGTAAISYMNMTGSDGSEVRVPMQDTAANPSSLPPAPAAPSSTSTQNTFTVTASDPRVTAFCGFTSVTTTSLQDAGTKFACNFAVVSAINAYQTADKVKSYSATNCSGQTCMISAVFDFTAVNGNPNHETNWGFQTIYPTVACPSGYTLSGSTCNLANARAAVSDNKQDYSRANGQFVPALDDLDAVGGTGIRSFKDSSGKLVIVGAGSGPAATCNGVPCSAMATYQILANGGTYATFAEERTDSAGTPYVKTQTLETDSTGKPVALSQSNSNGTLNKDVPNSGTATAPAIAAGTGVAGVPPVTTTPFVTVIAPAAGAVAAAPAVQASSPSTPITFPNDYARAGEIAASTAPLRDTAALADPAAFTNADMPTFGDTFTNLLGWRLPAHTSTCPAPSIDLSGMFGSGKTFVMNSHCALVDNNAGTIRAAMAVAYTIMALFIILRA